MDTRKFWRPLMRPLWNITAVISILILILPAVPAAASSTPDPTTVTLVGSLQAVLGCSGDWTPGCEDSYLLYDAEDDVWQQSFTLPGGYYEYKAALNDSWDENYGRYGVPGGDNIPLSLGEEKAVKFYYDHKTNWITDNQNSIIATVAGSFQSEIGCAGDWDPACLRSWLQDADEDGIYTFSTTSIPPGDYEAKVTIDETWVLNYGAGGAQNGDNIPFSVAANNSTVAFSYDSSTHVLSIEVTAAEPSLDNNVEWDGLRHDSRDLLYRTPGGAVTAGTPVTLRFRTFHNDVDSVKIRTYDINAGAQSIHEMAVEASDVSCYQADLENSSCDYWAYNLPNTQPNNFWYRFIITDGTKTVYYADDTSALDGGMGEPSDTVVDNSFALMVYDPEFSTPSWAQDAVIYQIFPDRFRNGRANNDPKTGDIRYDDPVLKLPWNTLPEGYCRAYADAADNCPWRYGEPTSGDVTLYESPRGRDYMGGDLKGVDQNLDYLISLGVNTLYFNPIFDSGSNHGYDTQDYYKIDPYFGTQKDWDNLVKHANQHGVRIVLDGVFNHMSSDSPAFDRYGHSKIVGACESLTSPYRDWFTFHDVAAGTGTCAGTAGPKSATYDGWFGYDSIPVLNKSNAEVQALFLTNDNSVARYWLVNGASAWRLDVMSDSSFPTGYWQSFREIVKSTKPDALIIGEMWQKDSTLLRFLRGDLADTTMNYRLRDAVVGLLAPGAFDSKGFADSGRILDVSEFANRLASIQEDYPDGAYYSLMNLLGSHDTARLLWVLTPGDATQADKEQNAANLAVGKQQQKIAALIQFTLPGAPTIYYGDEVAMTGNDDPDDRRTYPWIDKGGSPDMDMFAHYQTLASLRKANAVLTDGGLSILLVDDASETVAYGRKTTGQAAIVAINRSTETRTVAVPVAEFVPDGLEFTSLYGVGSTGTTVVTSSNGLVEVELAAGSTWLLATGDVDLLPPDAPSGLTVEEGDAVITLNWLASADTAGYNVYRSPVSGGGWVKINDTPLADPTFTDTSVENSRLYYYTVTALDSIGNESTKSQEADGMPHLSIGWANTQWPYTITHELSLVNRTDTIYGQVWIDGVTNQPGVTPGLLAEVGFGPEGTNPAYNLDWTWVSAGFNVNAGNNDELMASLQPEIAGSYDYLYRYSTTAGRDWLYADLNGPVAEGALPDNPGKMVVNPSSDIVAPETPANLIVVSASPEGIELAWDAIVGDPTLYGYEILRGAANGGPYTMIDRVTSTGYTDTQLSEGDTFYYVVRAVDNGLNHSGDSNEVSGTAALRTVTLVFTVTVPATTDATGSSVYIAGYLDRLDGNMPQWDPAGVVLTRVDATHWTITLTGYESVQIEYKYALGSWEFVEKDAACGEIGNRQLTLSYGATGVMTVNDTVGEWRNVSPCGN